MDTALSLGIVAGILQLVAFGLYNKQIFKGTSIPNTATWTLWTFLTVLNVSSYAVITADVAKYMLSAASAFATIGTFIYSLFTGKFKKIDFWGWLVVGLGVVAGIVWYWYRSVTGANLIVIGAVTVAFWPLCRALWKDPSLERPLAWYVWAAAYSILTLVIIMRWTGQWVELVYPVSMAALHFYVGWLARRQYDIRKLKPPG